MKRGRFVGPLFSRVFRPRSAGLARPVRTRHFGPLLAFLVPTIVVGYGLLIPRSCIAGVNQLTLGFASTLAGAALTYWLGIRSALRDGAD
jgi:hypothetical protein